MKRFFGSGAIVFSFLFTIISEGEAQEWTRFRGPNGAGKSDAKTIPAHWTENDANWKVALPGTGHSSPVLWADKIFLSSTDESTGTLSVLCLDTEDGKTLWKREFSLTPFQKHKFNSFASSTPAVDERHVFISWTTPGQYFLTALDHGGKTVWEKDLGPYKSQHGGGASPIVYKDTVIVNNDQDGQSSLLALDAATGKERWKRSRNSAGAAYSTPCVYHPDGQKPSLIFNSEAHGITAVDPDSGNLFWEYPNAFDKRSVSSPIVASGLIFGSCGSGAGGNYLVAIRPGDTDGKKKPELAYEIRRSAPYVPTSVAVNDLLFLWSDGGVVSCLHAPSGEIKWQERVGGNYFASPILVDGKVINISTSGVLVVLQASEQFRQLARLPLNETAHATPAVAGGRMYIRTLSHLISVGGKKS